MKIKVLHVVTRFGPGGVTEALFSINRHADKNTFEIYFISGLEEDLKFDKSALAKEKGLRVEIVPYLQREINLFRDTISLIRLYKFIKAGKFNIVHTHCSKAGVLGRIAARLAGVSVIIHQPHGHVFKGMFKKVPTVFFIIIEKVLSLITDRIVVLTEQGRLDHVRFRISRNKKFEVIPHGIDFDRFYNVKIDIKDKKNRLGLLDCPLVLGTVAHLVERKGYPFLFAAIKEVKKLFPALKLIIVGEGHLKTNLENMACEYGISDNCEFLGPRDDVCEIYPILDIFVLCSVNEGMGRVLIEAMSCGKPIVATDVMGITSVVRNNITGLLVKSRDYKAIAEAIIKLAQNKELASQIGVAAKLEFISNPAFRDTIMVERIENLYKEILSNKKPH